jgi:hypothetical protein
MTGKDKLAILLMSLGFVIFMAAALMPIPPFIFNIAIWSKLIVGGGFSIYIGFLLFIID